LFDLQPTLQSEILLLRPLRAEDFDSLFAVASDPLIWEQHPVADRYKENVFQDFFRESRESGGVLVAIDSRDGEVRRPAASWEPAKLSASVGRERAGKRSLG
jgi:hypothetical protein